MTRDNPDPQAALTPREREALAHIGAGHSVTHAASQMHCSESTVKTLLGRARVKLGAHNRGGTLAAAFRLGLVS